MITIEQIKLLKKANTSVDAEKTKERVPADFKASSKDVKKEIITLSGLSDNTFYNIANSGAASPKVVVSMSQILNVSPRYYTGEIDEKEPCNTRTLNAFYKKYVNEKLINEQTIESEVTVEKTENSEPENVDVLEKQVENKLVDDIRKSEVENDISTDYTPNDDQALVYTLEFDDSDKMNKAVKDLGEESAMFLLRALYKRSEAGGDAEDLCDVVKRCLLA